MKQDGTSLPAGDLEVDVVVVGAGPGGMAAVAAASQCGVEVAAIEATDQIGGNAVRSTGYLAFVNSRMQADQGITDSVEAFMADARKMAAHISRKYAVMFDEGLARRFASESAATFDFLTQRGIRFSRFISLPDMHSVNRVIALEDPPALKNVYEEFFTAPNVRTLFNTRALRLIADDGKITGITVQTAGAAPVTIRTRRGVVLAAGGYQANQALRRRYQPEFLAGTPCLGLDTCRGDGHLMGQAVGGDLINMTVIPPLVIAASAFLEDAIAIDRDGRRFHNEVGPYDVRVGALTAQPGEYGWYVFDAPAQKKRANLIVQMPKPAVEADTLEALAAKMGCAADGLVATVAEWNAFLASDAAVDPRFRRTVLPEGRRPLSEGPFYAVPMVLGINFISGGFAVTADMQVLDVFGQAIEGLFAAGDCVGGFNPVAELGGIHINGGLTLGRIAGRAAALGLHSTSTASDMSDERKLAVGAKIELFSTR